MKYIEFFDKNSIENFCACLHKLPEEIILIGDNAAAMKKRMSNYQKVLEGRGENVKFSCRTISRWKVGQVLNVLEEVVAETEDCVFGITGGDELVIFALGMLCERHKEKKIQVHRISIQNNTVYDCDWDGTTLGQGNPKLTVAENVQIYGGKVICRDESNPYTWNVTPEFVDDVEKMWEVCKKKPRDWNSHLGVFVALEKSGSVSEDLLTVDVKKEEIENYCKKQRGNLGYLKSLIKDLCAAKVIAIQEKDSERIILKYKSSQVRECLTKAGQVLELKIYLTAKSLSIYNDAMTGVEIDWDGKIHESEEECDTINEIDVFLMHNMIPIFISCKNGDVTSDELYKIQTVAERFGGKYAKKVLITSALNQLHGGELLKQRAEDMNIRVITGNDLMDDEKLKKKLENLWR